MTHAVSKFERNFVQSQNLLALAASVDALTTGALDVSDVLRSALVAAVSAQDDYVHSAVRELMIEIADGSRTSTGAFDRFSVPMSAVKQSSYLPSAIWLDMAVRDQHKHLSFQQPDKIADAVRLVSDISLWIELGKTLGQTPDALKTTQKLIVARRNQIVHEADCEPAPPFERRPISHSDVSNALAFISDLVHAMEALIV